MNNSGENKPTQVVSSKRRAQVIAWGAVIFFVAAWFPFLWLSFYNLPIGMHEWDWMTNEAGRFSGSWWDTQVMIYTEVMGRYTSNAVLSLTALWCSLSSFPYFFFFWQLAWMGAIFITVRALLKGHSLKAHLWIAMGIQILYLCYVEDVYDSLFRYTAIITYQMGTVLGMMSLIFFLRNDGYSKYKGFYFLLALTFMVLGIGTNEISMIFILLVMAALVVYKNGFRKEATPDYIMALTIAVFCSMVVALSPGNEIRAEAEQAGLGMAELLMTTIGVSSFLWFDWIAQGILPLMTILVIPLIRWTGKRLEGQWIFRDYRPWLWILVSIVPGTMGVLLYSTGGDTFPERVVDHLFIHVIFVWLGLCVSLGYKFNIRGEIEKIAGNHWVRTGYIICLLVVMFNIFGDGISINRNDKVNRHRYVYLVQSDSNIANAWLTLWKGEPQSYYRFSVRELNKLHDCITDTCYLQKPLIIPSQLYDPLSDRRNKTGDRYIGYYFNPAIRRVMYYKE